MGRRTLTVAELKFHEKRKRNGASYAPADLDGDDLLDVFEKWAAALSSDDTIDQQRQSWIEVTSLSRYAPRVLVVTLGVGAYGEAGPIVDATTGEKVFELTEEQAPTGENRAVLMVPGNGESAFYLAEQSSRGSAGGHLLRLFRKHFSEFSDEITMVFEAVTESEAWSTQAELKEVEVRIKGRSADIADGPHVEVGTFSYTARPVKRHSFPRDLLKKLRDDTHAAGQVVGISTVPEDSDVFVTMVRDGRQKKFEVGGVGAPTFREVLNEADSAPLGESELVERCVERVSDLCGRTGGTWNAQWSTPQGG